MNLKLNNKNRREIKKNKKFYDNNLFHKFLAVRLRIISLYQNLFI